VYFPHSSAARTTVLLLEVCTRGGVSWPSAAEPHAITEICAHPSPPAHIQRYPQRPGTAQGAPHGLLTLHPFHSFHSHRAASIPPNRRHSRHSNEPPALPALCRAAGTPPRRRLHHITGTPQSRRHSPSPPPPPHHLHSAEPPALQPPALRQAAGTPPSQPAHTLSTGTQSENGLGRPVRGVSQTPTCMRVVCPFS
jgi:hypothetical protein